MLVPNQQQINLGRSRNGFPNRFKFTLKNPTDKPIVITEIKVGCGSCTTAHTDKSIVEAGGTTDVHVVFTPKDTGMQVKSVHIFMGKEKLSLKFSAEVHV